MPVFIAQAQDNSGDDEAKKNEARVTVVVNDVKLLAEGVDPQPAEVDKVVNEDTSVRTGEASRSELTFLDLTIERLGSNTIFSFNKAGRTVQLNSGSILLRVPKKTGGANIRTSACSVAITGTVLILEVRPDGRNTLAVLNGGARMSLNKHPNESAFAHGGQFLNVPANAKKMPKPMNIDVKRIVHAHPLFTNFPPLPGEDDLYSDNQPAGGSSSTPSPPPVVYNPTGPGGPPPSGPITTGPILNPTGNFPPPGGIVPVDTWPVDTPTHNKRRDGDKPNHKKTDGHKPNPNKNNGDRNTNNGNKNNGNKGNGKGAGGGNNGPVVNANGVAQPVGNANADPGGKPPVLGKVIGQPAKPTPTPHRRIRKKRGVI
jgi:hypothetical protein